MRVNQDHCGKEQKLQKFFIRLWYFRVNEISVLDLLTIVHAAAIPINFKKYKTSFLHPQQDCDVVLHLSNRSVAQRRLLMRVVTRAVKGCQQKIQSAGLKITKIFLTLLKSPLPCSSIAFVQAIISGRKLLNDARQDQGYEIVNNLPKKTNIPMMIRYNAIATTIANDIIKRQHIHCPVLSSSVKKMHAKLRFWDRR